MPAELLHHAGRRYAVQSSYALPFDAWSLELSEAVPAPAWWADLPGAPTSLPGAAFVLAFVPDEDPDVEPTVHFDRRHGHVIPY
jgi:hypothetical protein